MAAHESPAAVLDHIVADRLRAQARQLAADLPGIVTGNPEGIWEWAGGAAYLLRELARG